MKSKLMIAGFVWNQGRVHFVIGYEAADTYFVDPVWWTTLLLVSNLVKSTASDAPILTALNEPRKRKRGKRKRRRKKKDDQCGLSRHQQFHQKN